MPGASSTLVSRMPSGQKKQQWIAPVNDNTLVLEHARTQDLRDPRVLGKGPCQDKHKNPMKPEIDREVEGLKWGGNQYGRWADCQVCALRLLYYPKEAHVGKYASNEPAPVVEKALQMIKDNGYANKCTHKVVKTFLELAEAEMELVKNSKKTNQRPEDKPDEDPKDKPDEDPKQKKKEDEAPKQARAAPCRRNFAQRPTAPRPASAASSSSGPVMVEPAHVSSASDDEDELVDVKELRERINDLKRQNEELRKKKEEETPQPEVSAATL